MQSQNTMFNVMGQIACVYFLLTW